MRSLAGEGIRWQERARQAQGGQAQGGQAQGPARTSEDWGRLEGGRRGARGLVR